MIFRLFTSMQYFYNKEKRTLSEFKINKSFPLTTTCTRVSTYRTKSKKLLLD